MSSIKRTLQERNIFIESVRSDLNNLRFDLNYRILACINGNMKLIIIDMTKTVEIYDLQSDFNEKRNIYYIQKYEFLKLNKYIDDHYQILNELKNRTDNYKEHNYN